jgi:hypothetical protein
MLKTDRFRLSCVVAAMMSLDTVAPAAAQTPAAPEQRPATMLAPPKPMTPARLAWLKARCAQLVAYYDYYGSDRSEHTDGARNHKRIGAVIECSRGNYRTGIEAMAALMKSKGVDLPKPGTPVVEPEDAESSDITDPTRQQY